MSGARILTGDALELLRTLPDESAQTCVTSPPYWGLRDYGVAEQLGLERTPEEYVARLVEVFREVRRVLAKDGTCWLNLGDSYASDMKGSGGGWANDPKNYAFVAQKRTPTRSQHGLKPKDLVGIPWRVAFALQSDGWWLRSDIIWAKPNPMPESVTDRPTKAHEYVFLLAKSERYYYDAKSIQESGSGVAWNSARSTFANPGKKKAQHIANGFRTAGGDTHHDDIDRVGRNARTVWSIATTPYSEAHFATFPEELARRCILAGSREGDTVLDPFAGAGTTGLVALKAARRFVGIELNPEYVAMAERRLDPLVRQIRAL